MAGAYSPEAILSTGRTDCPQQRLLLYAGNTRPELKFKRYAYAGLPVLSDDDQ